MKYACRRRFASVPVQLTLKSCLHNNNLPGNRPQSALACGRRTGEKYLTGEKTPINLDNYETKFNQKTLSDLQDFHRDWIIF